MFMKRAKKYYIILLYYAPWEHRSSIVYNTIRKMTTPKYFGSSFKAIAYNLRFITISICGYLLFFKIENISLDRINNNCLTLQSI